LKAAEDSLKDLKKEDFDILKTFSKPPEMVAKVIDAVVVLFNEKGEGNWS